MLGPYGDDGIGGISRRLNTSGVGRRFISSGRRV